MTPCEDAQFDYLDNLLDGETIDVGDEGSDSEEPSDPHRQDRDYLVRAISSNDPNIIQHADNIIALLLKFSFGLNHVDMAAAISVALLVMASGEVFCSANVNLSKIINSKVLATYILIRYLATRLRQNVDPEVLIAAASKAMVAFATNSYEFCLNTLEALLAVEPFSA